MSGSDPRAFVVGVISDTHGPLRPEAETALSGADHILCAGDIGSPEVLPALRRIAPTTAVEGNMDFPEMIGDLPRSALVELAGLRFLVIHDLNRIDRRPEEEGICAVVHGHTHRAEVAWKDGVLYVNPGSAGDPRALKAPTVALLAISGGRIRPRIVPLR